MESGRTTGRKRIPSRRWAGAMVAAALAALVGIGLHFGPGLLAPEVYATISIDINPSLEMSLDRNLEVVSVKAMNQEAEAVLATVRLRNLSWRAAVERWVEAVRATKRFRLETMLVSAVMPESAEILRAAIRTIQENPGTGVMAGIEVRVLYSNDLAVTQVAERNGLSVGRQMLLTQAELQNRSDDAAGIETAPVGELVRNLLRNRDMNQTGYTSEGETDPSDQPSASGGVERSQNGNGEPDPNPSVTPAGAANQEQNQGEAGQNREANGTPSPSCTPQGDRNQGSEPGAGGPSNPSCTPLADPTGAMKGR